MIVLAADPGGRWTGLCVRSGRDVLAHEVLTRDADEDGPRGIGVGPVYIGQVVDRYAELAAQYGVELRALEGLRKPNPHNRRRDGNSLIDVTGVLGAAAVYGGILRAYPDATVIPPDSHGSKVLGAYPLELVGPRERTGANWKLRTGTGTLRHARSAYDIAGAADLHARMWARKQA